MVPYDKMMINRLLDSYEQSRLSVGENIRSVNIEMRFTRKTVPAYFDESAAEYEKIHFWAKELEAKELIVILWKDKKVDHIIEKIRLNTTRLSLAYEYVKRTPKSCSEESMAHVLRDYIGTSPVCGAFAGYLLQRIEEHKSVKEYIDLNDTEDAKRLLEIIKKIEGNERPLYVREFSIKVLRDSKAFEKMEHKVAGIFRRFHADVREMDLSEILAEYNIYHTPNYVYLKGNCKLCIGDETIDLSALKQGIGVSGDDIEGIRILQLKQVQRVITIENLTTFFRFSEEDSLMIYLGGYHNKSRRMLLQKIYHEMPDVSYYHFGDIDAGGFQIFYDLKEKTGIPFIMHLMDMETLTKFQKYGKPLTNMDKQRLQRLAEHDDIADIVDYMLEQNIKLEQECILV